MRRYGGLAKALGVEEVRRDCRGSSASADLHPQPSPVAGHSFFYSFRQSSQPRLLPRVSVETAASKVTEHITVTEIRCT